MSYLLNLRLMSEACFSRGDGVSGMVDIEVNHDPYGFPFLGGRALKGMLHAEAQQLIAALEKAGAANHDRAKEAMLTLFGGRDPNRPGGRYGKLNIGDALLPRDLRTAVAETWHDASGNALYHPHDILETLTTIRHQTAIDEQTGAPKEHTLRAVRVILRELDFQSVLEVRTESLNDLEIGFLMAVVNLFHRTGSQKTRGLGRIRATLADKNGQDLSSTYLQKFTGGFNA